jgi:hypothetical protein
MRHLSGTEDELGAPGMPVPNGSPIDSYDHAAPAALVIADCERYGRVAADTLALIGIRARGPLSFAEVARDLGSFDGLDLIVIEGAAAPEMLLETVFARADTIARERSLGIVATVLPEQIDTAAAQMLGPRTVLLCDPTESERTSAVAFARWQARGALNDATRDAESVRLQRLNEEVARIADTLARLTRNESVERQAGVRDTGRGYRGPDEGEPAGTTAQEIRAVIRSRRLRAQYFAGELFADPAWDMLLDLFAAGLERRRVSVSSLCIAAAVPPTTALRWIGTLHDAGLFERQDDPADRRRAYIALSAKGGDGMRGYVGAVKRAGLPLV